MISNFLSPNIDSFSLDSSHGILKLLLIYLAWIGLSSSPYELKPIFRASSKKYPAPEPISRRRPFLVNDLIILRWCLAYNLFIKFLDIWDFADIWASSCPYKSMICSIDGCGEI